MNLQSNGLNQLGISYQYERNSFVKGIKLISKGSVLSLRDNSSQIHNDTLNKDYSLSNLDKSFFHNNDRQEQQPHDFKLIISPRERQQSQSFQQNFFNWVKNTKIQTTHYFGINHLQEYEVLNAKNTLKIPDDETTLNFHQVDYVQNSNNMLLSHYNPNRHFILQIVGLSGIYWYDIQKLSLKQKFNNQLYCRMIITLVEVNKQNSLRMIQYPKKIRTELIRLQRKENRDRKANNKNLKYQNGRQMNEKGASDHEYGSDEKICVYFYSNKKSICIQVELILYQMRRYDEGMNGEELVIGEECFSFARISLEEEVNNANGNVQQRSESVYENSSKTPLQKYDSLYSSQSFNTILNQHNCYGLLHYQILNSQNYSLLQKFIPSDCPVCHQDIIPGILGTHLPKVHDYLFQISPSTQVKSLYLEVQTLELPTNWLLEAKEKVQKDFLYKKLSTQLVLNKKQRINFSSLQLSVIVHNGIKQVSKRCCQLFEIMEVQKRVQNQTEKDNQLLESQNELLLKGKNDGLLKELMQTQIHNDFVQIKIFSGSHLFMPQIYCEDNFFIILQIWQQVSIQNNLEAQNNKGTQQLLIPVGFAFIDPQGIMNSNLIQMKLYFGWYLSQSTVLQSNQEHLQIGKRLHSRSQISKKNFIYSSHQLSKITLTCSINEPQPENSQKDNISVSLNQAQQLLHNSIVIQNQQAKINGEKQKLIKRVMTSFNQPKQSKLQVQKKIQIKQEINLIKNPQGLYITKNSFLKQTIQKKRISELKDFLKELKVQKGVMKVQKAVNKNKLNKQCQNVIVKLLELGSELKGERMTRKLFRYVFEENRKLEKDYFMSYGKFFGERLMKNSVLSEKVHEWYSSNLQTIVEGERKQKIRSSSPLSIINERNSMLLESKHNDENYRFERTPTEVLRTELAEVNYNYLIFINPLSIKPMQRPNQSYYSFPHRFFLQINFWNYQNQTSPSFQIDPSTGEILVEQRTTSFNNQFSHDFKPNSSNNQSQSAKYFSTNQTNSKSYHKSKQQPFVDQNIQKQLNSNQIKLKKVFHFEYGLEEEFVNSKDLFLDFIDYLYNGLMEISIYDEFRQIGKGFFKLRNLIRRRKNQASTVLEEVMHCKEGPVFQLKIECKSLRKQRLKVEKRIFKQKQMKVEQKKRMIVEQKNNEVEREAFCDSESDKIVFDGKQKDRIERFKKRKEWKELENISCSKNEQDICRLIQKNYVTSEFKLKVFPMKFHYLLLDLQNRCGRKALFYLKVNDPDQQLFNELYPQPQLQIIRNFHSQIDSATKERIITIQSNRERLLNYKNLTQNYEVELEDKQKIVVVCQYFSYRTFASQKSLLSLSNSQQIKIYNHAHTITVSLLQAALQSTVSSISKIHISPQPQIPLVKIEQTVKKHSKLMIPLPFLPSSLAIKKYDFYINDNKCKILYEDPFVNELEQQREFNRVKQRYHSTQRHGNNYLLVSPKGVYEYENEYFSPKSEVRQPPKEGKRIELMNRKDRIELMNRKVVEQNVSMFGQKVVVHGDEEMKKTMRNNKQFNFSGTKNNQPKKGKCINFISLYMPSKFFNQKEQRKINDNNIFQLQRNCKSLFMVPKSNQKNLSTINIQIRLDQVDQEEVMKLPLFETVKSTLRIPHSLIPQINQRRPKLIGIVSSHPEFTPSFQWAQIDYEGKSQTQLAFNFTSTIYGQTSFYLLLIDPLQYSLFQNTLVKQSQAHLQLLSKSYLNKILYTVITSFPSLKAQLTINLSSTQSVINQPFVYTNSSQFNIIVHIYTSHPHLVSLPEKDKTTEIKGKCQKRLNLKINVKEIFHQYLRSVQSFIQSDNTSVIQFSKARSLQNFCPTVVIGFVSDRVVEHFGFQFKFV